MSIASSEVGSYSITDDREGGSGTVAVAKTSGTWEQRGALAGAFIGGIIGGKEGAVIGGLVGARSAKLSTNAWRTNPHVDRWLPCPLSLLAASHELPAARAELFRGPTPRRIRPAPRGSESSGDTRRHGHSVSC
jgi:hypothetical protein